MIRGINIIVIFKYFLYILISTQNFIKIIFNSNLRNYYIPNLGIKNIIYIDPNKIRYVNSIPMKFHKSTKFIINFDWYKKNIDLEEKIEHPTFITCNQLFIEGKSIEECENYFFFKDKIKRHKIYKNCKNHEDIINFYKKKIKLFESLKKKGIKKTFLFNIQFMIDKNFNLVKINSGNHRIAISRILNIKKIPIEIKLIHNECFSSDKNKKVGLNEINKLIKSIEIKYS